MGGDNSNFVFRQKLVGEDGSVRQGVVMVKQPGLFLPNLRAMSSHTFMQSLQNFTAEPGIHSLACWDKFFVHNPLGLQMAAPVRNILDRTSYVGMNGWTCSNFLYDVCLSFKLFY